MPEQTQPSPIRHDVFLSPIPCRTAPGDPKRPPRAKGPLPHIPPPRAVGSSLSLRIAARPLVTPFHPPRMATVARCHLPIKTFGFSHDIKSNFFNREVVDSPGKLTSAHPSRTLCTPWTSGDAELAPQTAHGSLNSTPLMHFGPHGPREGLILPLIKTAQGALVPHPTHALRAPYGLHRPWAGSPRRLTGASIPLAHIVPHGPPEAPRWLLKAARRSLD